MPGKEFTSTIFNRRGPNIVADKSRVLLRRLYPGSHEKARGIVDRILALSDSQIEEEWSVVKDEWGNRHKNLDGMLRHRYREIVANLNFRADRGEACKCLIGAYFMHEYSIESAALFNPSIVPHPDQSTVSPGSLRFILSLRATGEGHISSVSFREGTIGTHDRISLYPTDPTISDAKREGEDRFEKSRFMDLLNASKGVQRAFSEEHRVFQDEVLGSLKDVFTVDELRRACSNCLALHPRTAAMDETVQGLLLLAESNYTVRFDPTSTMSERVLFPSAPSQSNGIEDARFVQFTHDDGSKVYYATFTAYNGRSAVPQLIETKDFVRIDFVTMSGNAIMNKGMALFPRKIQGKYWMLSRQDDENVMIMSSDSLLKWDDPSVVLRPQEPWEMFKMGNCGSPIETPKGWLVLTHGVGPMRRYCLGVAMLDLNDPTKVIGRMKSPLIAPNEAEREGYVPNVVYACGALLHNNTLVIPYATSDSMSSFGTVSLTDLYGALGV
jgi:predicted GH43/DUF377 family glycosyl hydrolase